MSEQGIDRIHNEFLEADRLRLDPAFQGAVTAARKEAVEALVNIDPTDTDKIRDAQAMVRAIDKLATNIGHAILRWKALPPDQQNQALGDQPEIRASLAQPHANNPS